MAKGLSTTLGRRQSAALWLVTVAGIAAAAAALASLATAADALVVWCRDFVVAASTRSGATAIGVFALLATVGTVSAVNVVTFLFSEITSSRRLAAAARGRALPLSGRVRAALRLAAPDHGTAVQLVDDAEPYAVTVGLLRPRILLSSALACGLTRHELAAVLSHERFHAQRRHPLRAVTWELFRRTFFFLPILNDVAAHFSLSREIAADRAAAANRAGVKPLASALLKLVERDRTPRVAAMPSCAAPFGHLRSRIAALSGNDRAELRLSGHRAFATAAVTLALTFASGGAGSASAQSPPGGSRCPAPAQSAGMSAVNFSPYFSILVPDDPAMSPAPPVQSSEVGR